MILMLACFRSRQLAERDTMLSCANILQICAEAYDLLMPSLAPGNIINKEGVEEKGRVGDVKEKERPGGGR